MTAIADPRSALIVALDTPRGSEAAAWAKQVAPFCGAIKLGLEFFAAAGPAGVAALHGPPLFLDLKLHDIPATVAGAVRAVLQLRPAMLTLHAAGGAAMIAAARQAADTVSEPPVLLAVTVLTSLDAAALAETGVAGAPQDQVLRLAAMALAAGADGLVCSAHEVAAVRRRFGAGPRLVVPGIRPAGTASHDQARTLPPRAAINAGADFIVVGRPITAAADPAAAAAAVLAEITPACASRSAA